MSAPPAATAPSPALPDLSRFLNPRAIAVVGATSDLNRIGGQPLKLLTEFGYAGKVYPVNQKHAEIKGLACFPDVSAVPQPCDMALVAVSAAQVPGVIEQCGAAGIPFALVLSSGFSEIGGEGKTLQSNLAAAARKAGVRVVGPNCLGMLNLRDHVRAGFGGTSQLMSLKSGPLAMVTQSGGFGFGVVAIACHYGLGFNYALSTGNEADLTLLDWLADFLERPEVEVVVAFMEGVTDGRRMIEIGARALELGKPILVWKVGNTEIGRKAATSHTARMTAGYELFRTAFRQGGYIEIRDVDELIDISKVLLTRRVPAGNRVAVATLSGGAGVLLADRCVENGLVLPQLSAATTAKLRSIIVSFASAENPIDATAHGYNDNFASYSKVIREVLADPGIDQAIARSPRGKAARPWAEGLVEMLRTTEKPLVLNWPTSPDDNGDVMQYLEQNGVPCILAPGRAVRALAAATEFAQKRRAWQAQGKRGFSRAFERKALNLEGFGALGERRSKAILSAYGVPVVKEFLLTPAEVEALRKPPLDFPVVVKIESADVPHKTEAGAVRVNIADLASLKAAAREVVAATQRFRPGVRIDGILVQEMAGGLETIVGAVNDPFFGPTVAFGLGGIFTELLKDVTHRFAPFGLETARDMILEIRGAALLRGYRGQPALDIEALAEAVARLSQLIADHGDRISEIDVNPLFVREVGGGVVAADALIVLKD